MMDCGRAAGQKADRQTGGGDGATMERRCRVYVMPCLSGPYAHKLLAHLVQSLVCRSDVTLARYEEDGAVDAQASQLWHPVCGDAPQRLRLVHAEAQNNDAGLLASHLQRLLVFWLGAGVAEHHRDALRCGVGRQARRW